MVLRSWRELLRWPARRALPARALTDRDFGKELEALNLKPPHAVSVRDGERTASSLSDLGSIYAGARNPASHLAVKTSSMRLAAINGTGSKDIRSPRSRLEWCAGSADLDKPRPVPFGKPVIKRRRKEKSRLAVERAKIAHPGHPGLRINSAMIPGSSYHPLSPTGC
jgi:hypothetical protein